MELTENYSDNSEDSEYHEDDENYEVQIPLYYRKEIAANENSTDSLTSGENSCVVQNMLSSPDVASALDRINLSDRKFTILAAAIARANNEDLHEVSLSRSSIKRKRKYHRSTIHNHIREKFSEENVQLVVHWDTKIMNDSTTSVNFTSNTDRLAVVVTGCNVEKILGIVKIPVGTGDAQAKATHELLSLWEVSDNVVAMGFDTTATNTRHKKVHVLSWKSSLEENFYIYPVVITFMKSLLVKFSGYFLAQALVRLLVFSRDLRNFGETSIPAFTIL
jgi:hypothetical protein